LSRYVDPEKSKGNLPEVAPMTEFKEVIPSVSLPPLEEMLRNHSRALDAAERRPRIATASFRSRSLSSRF
jgi:hypothetical protein